MARDLAEYAKDNAVRFFLFNFTDLFGTQRAKLVPAEAVANTCHGRPRPVCYRPTLGPPSRDRQPRSKVPYGRWRCSIDPVAIPISIAVFQNAQADTDSQTDEIRG